jgi:hypothetical protein
MAGPIIRGTSPDRRRATKQVHPGTKSAAFIQWSSVSGVRCRMDTAQSWVNRRGPEAIPTMKFWYCLLVIWLAAPMVAIADEQGAIDMISWEFRGRQAYDRLTLYEDGRSEIELLRFGEPRGPLRPKWTLIRPPSQKYGLYRRENPISVADAKAKFAAAITAGVDQLKTVPRTTIGGSTTSVSFRRNGQVTRILICGFDKEVAENDKGSDNHLRFLELQRILGTFDTKPGDNAKQAK